MITMGIDLHSKRSRYVLVIQEGDIIEKGMVPSSPESFREVFSDLDPCKVQVAVEAI